MTERDDGSGRQVRESVELSITMAEYENPPLQLAENAWLGIKTEEVTTMRRDPDAWRVTESGPLLEMLRDIHLARSRREARIKAAVIAEILGPEEAEAIQIAKRMKGLLLDRRRRYMTTYHRQLIKHSPKKTP
jgi:hypothetical protein